MKKEEQIEEGNEAINAVAQQLATLQLSYGGHFPFYRSADPPVSRPPHGQSLGTPASTTSCSVDRSISQHRWTFSHSSYRPSRYYQRPLQPLEPRPVWNAPGYHFNPQVTVFEPIPQWRPYTSPNSSIEFRYDVPRVSLSDQKNETLYRFCAFCRSNRETKEVYESHILRDAEDKVVCPQLRNYICKTCGATGDNAHTESYCHQRAPGSPESLIKSKPRRMATGRLRKK